MPRHYSVVDVSFRDQQLRRAAWWSGHWWAIVNAVRSQSEVTIATFGISPLSYMLAWDARSDAKV